jgi:guanylate kinase
MEKKLILVTGPSGVGKTTIAYALLKDMPELERLVTFTTREQRPNEKDGIDYHFISREDFEEKIKNGQMFEYDEHYGYLYGNSKEDLEKIWKDNKIAMMVLDLQGVKTVLKVFPAATSIFLVPDTLDNLKNRILQRPMSQDDFDKRWEKATSEMKEASVCTNQIENAEDELEKTIEKVRNIILQ